jgi:hypothetical protein
MNCIHQAARGNQWWAVVNSVFIPSVPYNTSNFLSSSGTISFSRKTRLSDDFIKLFIVVHKIWQIQVNRFHEYSITKSTSRLAPQVGLALS